MAEWVHAGRFDEIADGRGRRVEILGLHLAIFRAGDAVIAFSDRCPHAGGFLGDGWIEECEVVCPLHRWRFRLRDGRCSTMRGEGVHRFPAELRGEDVWVYV